MSREARVMLVQRLARENRPYAEKMAKKYNLIF
jgi:hypothetical protein